MQMVVEKNLVIFTFKLLFAVFLKLPWELRNCSIQI